MLLVTVGVLLYNKAKELEGGVGGGGDKKKAHSLPTVSVLPAWMFVWLLLDVCVVIFGCLCGYF